VQRRYGVVLDPAGQCCRERLARSAVRFAQTVIDPTRRAPPWSAESLLSNLRSAALLAGAQTPSSPATRRAATRRLGAVDAATWRARSCSTFARRATHRHGDAAGAVAAAVELSDRHGFVIASDECYSEIYFPTRPAGQPAGRAGAGPHRLPQPVPSPACPAQHVPGLRSVRRGDAHCSTFLLYRNYHGSAMAHGAARQHRGLERRAHVSPTASSTAPSSRRSCAARACARRDAADAAFYLWPAFARRRRSRLARGLLAQYNSTSSGRLLAATCRPQPLNPGQGRVRLALRRPRCRMLQPRNASSPTPKAFDEPTELQA